MNILFVAGTWNKEGGKPSGLIEKMYNSLLSKMKTEDHIDYFNGGNYDNLESIINTATNYDVIFWMTNVPNDLPKVRDVKKANPYAILIGSKRNIDNEYSFVDVLNRTLLQRHNLSIMFSKLSSEKEYTMTLFDPLGTAWYEGKSTDELMKALVKRVRFLLTTTRKRTFKADGSVIIPNNQEFIDYVREVAEIFHETIQHSDGVTRFLGNSSFRGESNIIYVSERDVDKSTIDINHFVAAYTKNDVTYYYGDKKPSKDTIVQTYLYKAFPNINYIVHSHCYTEGGAWTKTPVPCGSLDELTEIAYAMKDYNDDYSGTYYKFNLKGHGCLIFGSTLEEMKQTKYITRELPERIYLQENI